MVVIVVTTGVDVVFRLISNFLNVSEMEKSCVACLWTDVNNVKAYLLCQKIYI